MGEDTTRNILSSFPEINNLCKVASRWKYIKRNILTMHGPLNVKKLYKIIDIESFLLLMYIQHNLTMKIFHKIVFSEWNQ